MGFAVRALLCRCVRRDRRALQPLTSAQQEPEHVLLSGGSWAEQAVAVQVHVALTQPLEGGV